MQHTAVVQSNRQMPHQQHDGKPSAPKPKLDAKGSPHSGKEDQLRQSTVQKILQIRANRDLAKRTVAALTVLIIYLVFVCATQSYKECPQLVIVFGLLLMGSIMARVMVAKRATTDDILASPAWLRRYTLTTLLMSAVWALFVCAIFFYYKTGWVSLLAVLSTAGIASAATSSIAPNARLAKTYVLIMVVPIIIMGLFEATRPSFTLSALLCICCGAHAHDQGQQSIILDQFVDD